MPAIRIRYCLSTDTVVVQNGLHVFDSINADAASPKKRGQISEQWSLLPYEVGNDLGGTVMLTTTG